MIIAKDEQLWAIMKFNCMKCHKDKPLSEATQLEYPIQFNETKNFQAINVKVTQRWAIVCRTCLNELTAHEGREERL
jgi:hypothetical protein